MISEDKSWHPACLLSTEELIILGAVQDQVGLLIIVVEDSFDDGREQGETVSC